MYYKYKIYQTPGPNGTTITHRQQDEVDVEILGEVNGYTYISSNNPLNLLEQPEQINIEQVTPKASVIAKFKHHQHEKSIRSNTEYIGQVVKELRERVALLEIGD